mmetsp:Transcript_9451/g.10416  ORF Transcript_9451/g.10416 Transcript_9451/m.10416 type:complete len:359 (-) Transcript_9451:1763-2839(-)
MFMWVSKYSLAAISFQAQVRSSCSISQALLQNRALKQVSGRCTNNRWHLSSSTSQARYLSNGSFDPPEPPAFTGTPVYDDIDLTSDPSKVANKRNEDINSVFVITGASRGIGLQMVKTLVERTNGRIIACCRSPLTAHSLNSFVESLPDSSSKRISVQTLDLEDQASISSLAQNIQESHNRVDLLLNVAGILGDGKTTPGPERSIRYLDREWVMKSMNVNYIGPLFLSQALAPMMKSKIGSQSNNERSESVIANLSARVGSISDNGLGGWLSYRSSKAALNQASRTMALELKRQGTWTVCLHPGTTNTDLSKPFQRNVKEGRLFPVEFTVDSLLNVIDRMDEDDSGGFYDWSGTALPF